MISHTYKIYHSQWIPDKCYIEYHTEDTTGHNITLLVISFESLCLKYFQFSNLSFIILITIISNWMLKVQFRIVCFESLKGHGKGWGMFLITSINVRKKYWPRCRSWEVMVLICYQYESTINLSYSLELKVLETSNVYSLNIVIKSYDIYQHTTTKKQPAGWLGRK